METDTPKITRRDFLKLATISLVGLAFKPFSPAKEGASNSNFETFTSDLGVNGLTIILNKDTETLSLFQGQPDKKEANGIKFIQVTGPLSPLVENSPLILSPEQLKKRRGVEKSVYQIKNIPIYSTLLAKGALGSEKYKKETLEKQELIEASPNKFTLLDADSNPIVGLLGKADIEIGRDWDRTPKYASVKIVSNDGEVSRWFRMYPAHPQETLPNEKFAESAGKGIFLIRAIPTARTTPEAPLSLPENIGGDPRYAVEIQKYEWAYNEDKTQVLVKWNKDGNFEVAAKLVNGEWRVDKNCKFIDIPEGYEKITGRETLPFSFWSRGAEKNEHFGIVRGYPDEAFIDFISTGKITQSPRYDFETGEQLPGQIFYIEAYTQKKDGTPIKFNIAVAVDMGNGKDKLAIGNGDPNHMGVYDIFYYAEGFGPGKKLAVRFVIGGSHKGPYYEYIESLYNDHKNFVEKGIVPVIIFPSPAFEQL